VSEIRSLVASLKRLSPTATEDLRGFEVWLDQQSVDGKFNVAALWTTDASGALRVCLHPKLVRSKFETNLEPEDHLTEANLLTLVTLWPTNPKFFSVTLQPLICSDALHLETDRAIPVPLLAVNQHAACLGERPPDQIDIVSIPTCTPQEGGVAKGTGRPFRQWHQRYREAFRSAAQEGSYPRHNGAAFVLANFRSVQSGRLDGLSGVFMPRPPVTTSFPPALHASYWGAAKGSDINTWSTPDDDVHDWRCRGVVAGLSPLVASAAGAVIRVFDFTIQRLPRDNPAWGAPAGLAACRVKIGSRNAGGKIAFALWDNANA
jgi:hypothetical protein